MQKNNPLSLPGCDLNEYRTVNFDEVKKTQKFVYLRASGSASGSFRVDKKFYQYAKECRARNIPVGAYHFSTPSYDVNESDLQCDKFIETLQNGFGKGDYGDLFPVIDVEYPLTKTIPTDVMLNWVDRFRNRFERKTRRRLMIYTGSWFIKLFDNFKHSKKGFILVNMPLWIAYYPDAPGNDLTYPPDGGGWTKWRVWQYTEKGEVKGVDPPVDLNWGPDNIDLLRVPRNVSNLNVKVLKDSFLVTWDKNSDIDLQGYNLFLNANYVKTLGKNATSYSIPRPQNLKEPITISIEAFDNDGDFSKTRTKKIIYPTGARGEFAIIDREEDIRFIDGMPVTFNKEKLDLEENIKCDVENKTIKDETKYRDVDDEFINAFVETSSFKENND